MLIQIQGNQKLLNIVRIDMVKKSCGNSGHEIIKLTASQEWINGLLKNLE